MDFEDTFDQFIDHFRILEKSYSGAILVYFAIEDFIPWMWCSPLPKKIIDFSSVPKFEIREQKCKFELRQVFLTDDEFKDILSSIRSKNNGILIKGEKYCISYVNPYAISNEYQIGLGKESLSSRRLTVSSDLKELQEKINSVFNTHIFYERLWAIKGVRSLSGLIEAYLPFNITDAPDTFSPSTQIYVHLPTYIKFRKCLIVDKTDVLTVLDNYGNFDPNGLNVIIVGPQIEPITLPYEMKNSVLCEPLITGKVTWDRNSIAFTGKVNNFLKSFQVNLVFQGIIIASSNLEETTTDLSAMIEPLNYFRASNRRGMSQLTIIGRYLSSSLSNIFGLVILIFVAVLSFYAIRGLIIEDLGLVSMLPTLTALSTLLLLYINFKNVVYLRNEGAKARVKRAVEQLNICQGALSAIKEELISRTYLNRDYYNVLVKDFQNLCKLVISKEFSLLYHRLRGIFIISKIRRYIVGMEASIKEVTLTRTEVELIDPETLQNITDCSVLLQLYQYKFKLWSLHHKLTELEKLTTYLNNMVLWLRLKYSFE